MSTALQRRQFTPEEYLKLEVAAEYKSEYYNGEIFAMAGASDEHSLIGINIGRELSIQLKGHRCRVHNSDLKVKVGRGVAYTYPDATVVCPPVETEENGNTSSVLNPTVIVEILSESTAAFDRGGKFALYRRIPSLREYVIIEQALPRVEVYTRGEDGMWVLREYDGLQAVAPLPSIDCRLALAEVYDKVSFPPPANSTTELPGD